jgi:hypothetical protein
MRAELETAHISMMTNTAMQMTGWNVRKECWKSNRKNSLWIQTNGQMPRTDWNLASIQPTERPTDRVISRPTNQTKPNQTNQSNWPTDRPTRPINQSINQLTNQTDRPTRSTNQPTNRNEISRPLILLLKHFRHFPQSLELNSGVKSKVKLSM